MKCMLCDRPIQFWQWYDDKMHQTFQSEDCGEHKLLFRVDVRDGNKKLVNANGVRVPVEHTGHTYPDQMDKYGTPGPMRKQYCDKQEEQILRRVKDMDRVALSPTTDAVADVERRFVPHEYGSRGQCEVMPMKIYHLRYVHHTEKKERPKQVMPEKSNLTFKPKSTGHSTPMPSDETIERIKEEGIAKRHQAWDAYKQSLKGESK